MVDSRKCQLLPFVDESVSIRQRQAGEQVKRPNINIRNVDLNRYSNRRGYITINAMSIGVEIIKARIRYGHIDLLVTPITGHGEKWIEIHKVSDINGDPMNYQVTLS